MLYNEATIGYERAAPLQSIHANNYGPPLGVKAIRTAGSTAEQQHALPYCIGKPIPYKLVT